MTFLVYRFSTLLSNEFSYFTYEIDSHSFILLDSFFRYNTFILNFFTMSFILPSLPYTLEALEPHISKETLEYHYGKHHQTYIDNLNRLIPGSEYE